MPIKKETFFNESQDKIFEIARKGGGKLAATLRTLISKMETDNGAVKNTLKNRKIMSEALKLIRIFYKNQSTTLSKVIEKQLSELVGINIDYFEREVKKKIDKEVYVKMIYQDTGFVGITSKLSDTGRLKELLKDNIVSKTIVAEISKAIKNGTLIGDLVKKITDYFFPKNSIGIIESQLFKNGGYDLLQRQDRVLNDAMAENLELNYAVYGGTVKDNTRHFCKERVNKVYSREEIKSWNNLQWEGKIPNSDVSITLGGYKCRHVLNYVSEETAKRLASTRGGINKYRKI